MVIPPQNTRPKAENRSTKNSTYDPFWLKIDGTVIYIENKVPYQFNGCAITEDLKKARKLAYAFIKERIAEKIEDGTIDTDDLCDDEEEALAFFSLR